jgi:hypothetical protein
MKIRYLISGALISALLFGSVAMAQPQHTRGGQRGQNHGQQHGERGRVDNGHGRNEGRHVDEYYRHENFGRNHHVLCGGFYGRPTFFFGGIWFGIDVWPSFWLSTDYVYVDYVDGDYFLVNERFPDARIAIVIE